MWWRGKPFLEDALYNWEWINQYSFIWNGHDYVLLTQGGCWWYWRFGGRYFTYKDLLIEFDVGEESGKVCGDVNGGVVLYRTLSAPEKIFIISSIFEVTQSSIGRWSMVYILRREWKFQNEIAQSPQMSIWLRVGSSGDDLSSLCLRHVICQSQRVLRVFCPCAQGLSWLSARSDCHGIFIMYPVYYFKKLA